MRQPPDSRRGRPGQETASPQTTAAATSSRIISPAAVSALLELSDERDQQLALRAAAWSQGYERGRRDGYDAGWTAAEDHGEREHQAVAAVVLETPQQSASRRLTAAMAGERRDQAEHWRRRWAELYRLSRDQKFVREAYATEPGKRGYEQTMALLLRAARTEAA
ncbi:MAG: hypothetical protein J2P30_00740 [Actinobacteria bacterium]|nr:hypothetical protein [Actinomycetota bacterium]